MTDSALFETLAVTAMTVGALHSLAPDHWIPFAAVARAQGWSAGRTARITLLCGFGHVSISAALGVLALVVGREAVERLGGRLESIAGVLLIAFGVGYAIYGVRRAVAERVHGHSHGTFDHVHSPAKTTAGALFVLFCCDPCVAVIPIVAAAGSLGTGRIVALVVLYEVATLAAMVALVLPARAGATVLRARWLDRWGDAAAGGVVVSVGILVAALGW